jgi:hypothetical protein
VLCDLNTAREYDTVNGQKARGGSLDVAGPVIAGGMLTSHPPMRNGVECRETCCSPILSAVNDDGIAAGSHSDCVH